MENNIANFIQLYSMKGDISRLGSVVRHGVGGPEAGALNLIYTYLLQKHAMDVYSFIMINQIGEDLNELIHMNGRKMHINIRYPVYPDFDSKTVAEKNRIRLDVAHMALLRIAEKEKKLDPTVLETIREEILKNDFSFEFALLKKVVNKKNKELTAQMMVKPEMDVFNYYIQIEEAGTIKCKVPIYCGITLLHYLPALFSKLKWQGKNEIIITGKEPHVETHIFTDQCRAEFINLTKYDKSPYFEMMRLDTNKTDRDRGYENWLDSMSPESSALLRRLDAEDEERMKQAKQNNSEN